jgi:hypothetical protein
MRDALLELAARIGEGAWDAHDRRLLRGTAWMHADAFREGVARRARAFAAAGRSLTA